MGPARTAVIAAFLIVLGVPFVFALLRPGEAAAPDGNAIIVITPHNEQIRSEFERAFSDWHLANHGEAVDIDWRTPGGTSEIRKQLVGLYGRALATGVLTPDMPESETVGLMPYDLLFGGGSYEHTEIKKGVNGRLPLSLDEMDAVLTAELNLSVTVKDGSLDRLKRVMDHDSDQYSLASKAELTPQQLQQLLTVISNVFDLDLAPVVNLPISVPVQISSEALAATFGDNSIGDGFLYEPDRYWVGTALSGFGIVFNRDTLKYLGLDEPRSWDDLTDPRYTGWLLLADPRMSGSVTTTYESILNNYGWEKGWATLRDMGANARAFTNSAPKIPIDVSLGEAAAGLAIDFYGRYQAQSVMGPGETPETSRVGYIDPPGLVYIDADPISKLRGGPNPELADRFIEFCLTDEAQALWQFTAIGDASSSESGGLGPRNFELRRMPVRRDIYDQYADRFVDQGVQPFEAASSTPNLGWRSSIPVMMAAFTISIHNDHRAAWNALNDARKAHEEGRLDQSVIDELESIYYAMPQHTFPDDYPQDPELAGKTLEFNPENYRAIRNAWRDQAGLAQARIEYTSFFRQRYREIVRRVSDLNI